MKYLDAKQIIEKYGELKGERGNWETLWQDLADFILPRKNNISVQRSEGEKKYVNLLDSTAMTSNELLAGALHGMLTNPSGYFFNLSTGKPALDKIDAVRQWIQDVVRLIHDVLNNTNFQTEVHEVYLDLSAFGTAIMLVEEADDVIIRFSTKFINEIFLKENSKGFVDCLYRCYEATAKDLVDDFGFDNLPKKVQDSFKNGKSNKYEVIHAVYPQSEKFINGKFNKTFKYVSHYVLKADKIDISVKGFREFPYVTPRWSKASGESYGRGPGEKALPSAKTANKMRETVLKGAQKVVDPPLQAPDDGFITQIDTRPAGLSYYRAGSQDRIQPIFNDSRIDFGFQAIDQERAQIREAYYTDQLKLGQGPQMTATEVSERVEQALRFLGPMLGRQQSEFLQPLIERIYAILERRQMLPAVPAELRGIPLKIQYSSVMAMSQRLSEIQNIQRTMQNIAPFASSDPAVLDNIDGDEALKFMARLFNFPQEIIRTQEDVKSIRDARAKQQQEMQEAINTQNTADAASKVVSASAKVKGSAVG